MTDIEKIVTAYVNQTHGMYTREYIREQIMELQKANFENKLDENRGIKSIDMNREYADIPSHTKFTKEYMERRAREDAEAPAREEEELMIKLRLKYNGRTTKSPYFQ